MERLPPEIVAEIMVFAQYSALAWVSRRYWAIFRARIMPKYGIRTVKDSLKHVDPKKLLIKNTKKPGQWLKITFYPWPVGWPTGQWVPLDPISTYFGAWEESQLTFEICGPGRQKICLTICFHIWVFSEKEMDYNFYFPEYADYCGKSYTSIKERATSEVVFIDVFEIFDTIMHDFIEMTEYAEILGPVLWKARHEYEKKLGEWLCPK